MNRQRFLTAVLALMVVLTGLVGIEGSSPVLACDVEAIEKEPVDNAIEGSDTGNTYSWDDAWVFSSYYEAPGCDGGLSEQLKLTGGETLDRGTLLSVIVSITQPDETWGEGWTRAAGQLDPGSVVLLSQVDEDGWVYVTRSGGNPEKVTFVAIATRVDPDTGMAFTTAMVLESIDQANWASILESLETGVTIPGFDPFAMVDRQEVAMAVLGE